MPDEISNGKLGFYRQPRRGDVMCSVGLNPEES